MEGGKLKAALYARVSTEDQAKEGFSIAAQLKRLEAYCRARDWSPIGRYIDDGHSGREVNRPAYQKMMDDRDLWDVLVVLKMDRIHRNSKNFAQMMDDFKEWGKEFNSMQESFDTTTAMGRFVMDIIQRIAQLESEQIGERVKMGMTEKAKKGKGPLGSGHPYGFSYDHGRLVLIEEEAVIVKGIYEDYLNGLTLRHIADSLNHRGVPSKRGGEWSKQAISNILRNPLYCGYLLWDGVLRRGEHESVIGVEEYNQVQRVLGRRIRNRSRPGKSIALESGRRSFG